VIATERCDLCGLPVPQEHDHLFDRERRTLACACPACAGAFAVLESGRFRMIHSVVRRLGAKPIADSTWASLGIPVGLAFVSRTTEGQVLAAYPGPAGVTVAQVDADAWSRVLAERPELCDLEPDVEAWLVDRRGRHQLRQYRISIDHCYRLAGLVRSNWRGLDGGAEAHAAIAGFFATLESDAA
jgi:hypothetical protein